MSLARNPAILYHISYKGLLAAKLKLVFLVAYRVDSTYRPELWSYKAIERCSSSLPGSSPPAAPAARAIEEFEEACCR
jgi:hypothetical protein